MSVCHDLKSAMMASSRWLVLQKARDLKNGKDHFADLSLLPWVAHLNDSFEKTYAYDEESLATREKEDRAIAFLDGVQHWLETVARYAATGDEPRPEVATESAMDPLIGRVAARYPGLSTGTTGTMAPRPPLHTVPGTPGT